MTGHSGHLRRPNILQNFRLLHNYSIQQICKETGLLREI